MNSVSCTSATNCVAVGHFDTGPTGDQVAHTLIETWDGTSWTIATSPDVGTVTNDLRSVSCTSLSSMRGGWRLLQQH